MAKKKRFLDLRYLLLSMCAILVLIMMSIAFTGRVSESLDKETDKIAHDAIVRALIACYAAEGSYPAEISHLEKHYGVVIDHDRFFVNYEIFASNIRPSVTLVRRK